MIRTKRPRTRTTQPQTKVVLIKTIKNTAQVFEEGVGSIQNYQVFEGGGWGIGRPLGGGATLEKAIKDFKKSWYEIFGESIEVVTTRRRTNN